MSTPLNEQLRQLRNAIVNKPPYCSGTIPVDEDELVVYYSKAKAEEAHRINLGAASATSLEHLAQTCEVATFGRNDEDVVDESYRKAGKLDKSDFSVKLDLEKNGLMAIIRGQLLEGHDAQQGVYAELYKLNVYGEGSFFKTHRDTPRGEIMFGSLVIVYPTEHEGGSLIFRDQKEEWTFDSAQAARSGTAVGPCVAYATFFSDVEHEVTRVTSRHRVTVTYNLYFVDPIAPTKISALPGLVSALADPGASTGLLVFRSALEKLLDDAEFLPAGGYLGFGLRRVYPLEKSSTETTVRSNWSNNYKTTRLSLSHLKQCLKGCDADVMSACAAFGLPTSLWLLFNSDRHDESFSVLLPHAPSIEGRRFDHPVPQELAHVKGAKRIPPVDLSKIDFEENVAVGRATRGRKKAAAKEDVQFDMKVHWVTKPTDFNVVKNSVIVYGNDADMGHAYGYISMIVQVGKPGARAAVVQNPNA